MDRKLLSAWLSSFFLLLFASHLYYMAFVRFDYGSNMVICVFLGALQAGLWGVWVTVTKHPAR